MALMEKGLQKIGAQADYQEIHITGYALTGISAGLDAVGVLIDIGPNRAKTSKRIRVVHGEGIQDGEGSQPQIRCHEG